MSLDETELGRLDIVMAGLAIFALVLLAISLIFELDPGQEELFGWVDLGICTVFITELGFRFRRAASKRRCLRESWADILGSIPSIVLEMAIIRGFRLFRVAKVARVARAAKVARVARATDAAKAVKALKLARKAPKIIKTVKKIRKRRR